MKEYTKKTFYIYGPELREMRTGPQGVFFKACLDCVTMAGVLLGAVLTTLIIGL